MIIMIIIILIYFNIFNYHHQDRYHASWIMTIIIMFMIHDQHHHINHVYLNTFNHFHIIIVYYTLFTYRVFGIPVWVRFQGWLAQSSLLDRVWAARGVPCSYGRYQGTRITDNRLHQFAHWKWHDTKRLYIQSCLNHLKPVYREQSSEIYAILTWFWDFPWFSCLEFHHVSEVWDKKSGVLWCRQPGWNGALQRKRSGFWGWDVKHEPSSQNWLPKSNFTNRFFWNGWVFHIFPPYRLITVIIYIV